MTDDDFRLARSNRVLIQTKTKPGFGLKSERDILEFEDAHGNGLTAPSDTVADDMMYGTSFDLNKIKDPRVRANLERLKEKSDDELFKYVINLSELVSRGQLQENNKRLIDTWRQQIYLLPKDRYSDIRLSYAVFEASQTKELVKTIVDLFKDQLQKVKGQIDDLSLSQLLSSGVRRPVFDIRTDLGHGLTFALNDTWGFKVVLSEYNLDNQTGEYLAKLQFDIYDHFGLDVEDVEQYGSEEKILAKLKLEGISGKPIDIGETIFPLVGTGRRFLQDARDGFGSWFILQYMRGYKPFVTLMSNEIVVKGNIKK